MLTAFGAMAKIFIVSAIGVYIATTPKGDPVFPPSCMKQISRVSNTVFLPYLIVYSMASAINGEILAKGCVLILFSAGANIFGIWLAGKFEWIHDDRDFGRVVTIACGTPNQLSLPIMVLTSMCGSSLVNEDYGGDAATCSNEAMSLLFVYAIGFSLVFWGYGFNVLQNLKSLRSRSNTLEAAKDAYAYTPDLSMIEVCDMTQLGPTNETGEETRGHVLTWEASVGNAATAAAASMDEPCDSTVAEETLSERVWRMFSKSFLNGNMMAQYVGIALAIVPGVQNFIFAENAILKPVADAIFTLGQPLVCVNCLVMAGSLTLTKSTYDLEYFGLGRLANAICTREQSATMRELPPTGQQGTKPSMTVMTDAQTINGGCPVTGMDKSGDGEEGFTVLAEDRPALKTMVLHSIIQLALMPALAFGLLVGALAIGLVGKEDRLIQLIIVVEGSAPSAQMMLVALNQLGRQDMAGKLAFLYVPHYLVSILTITAWSTLGATYIYG